MSDTPIAEGRDVPEFAGTPGALALLLIKTTFLQFVTLGIYSFWKRARLRRYYWHATRLGGVPFDYSGTGLEKLLGFLVAIVILAVYLIIVNIGLMILGISVFQGNPFIGQAAIIFVLPLLFAAQYRARRYVLSRTRWAGIRFSQAPGAGRYALVAAWHLLITILTLGILYPRQVFKLEKFRVDRTSYGDLQFVQGGRWQDLMRIWIPVPVFLATGATLTAVVALQFANGGSGVGFSTNGPMPLIGAVFAVFAIAGILAVRFAVLRFAVLAAGKRLGQTIAFRSDVEPGYVMGRYVLYAIALVAIGLAATLFLLVFGVVGAVTAATIAPEFSGVFAVVMALAYIALLFGLPLLFDLVVTQPVQRHYATTLTIANAGELMGARQGDADHVADADGFADALDVGAAI